MTNKYLEKLAKSSDHFPKSEAFKEMLKYKPSEGKHKIASPYGRRALATAAAIGLITGVAAMNKKTKIPGAGEPMKPEMPESKPVAAKPAKPKSALEKKAYRQIADSLGLTLLF